MLFGVLLLMAFAFAMLAVHHRDLAGAALEDRREAAGRLFAAWFLAAHRASQERDYSSAIAGSGLALTTDDLRLAGAVPPGLKEDGRIVLGLVDDGHGVPMAFAVFTGASAEAAAGLRAGALLAGLREVAHASSPGGAMARHRAAIEAALGAPLDAGALYVTADGGLAWRNDLLHRRPQPGRPWLNRMASDLAAGASGILDASRIAARSLAGRTGASAGAVTVAGDASAAGLRGGGGLDTAALDTPSLDVVRELSVGTFVAAGLVSAPSVDVTGGLQASSLAAASLAAQALAGGSRVRVAREAAVRSVAAGSLGPGTAIAAGRLATGRLYGPRLDVAGTLVAGRCAGC